MFENATKLDADFLKNEFNLNYSEDFMRVKAIDYYINICALIKNNYAGGVDMWGIESALDTDEKKYLFKAAQAKQLIYDISGGRGSMLRGEDGQFDVCRDCIDRLKILGFWRPAREM